MRISNLNKAAMLEEQKSESACIQSSRFFDNIMLSPGVKQKGGLEPLFSFGRHRAWQTQPVHILYVPDYVAVKESYEKIVLDQSYE